MWINPEAVFNLTKKRKPWRYEDQGSDVTVMKRKG
jgi:hypothetical protein